MDRPCNCEEQTFCDEYKGELERLMDETRAEEHATMPYWEAKVRFINQIALGWVIVLLALLFNALADIPSGVLLAVLALGAGYFSESAIKFRGRLLFACIIFTASSWAVWFLECVFDMIRTGASL